jgi:hypothetical protein
MFKFIKGKKKKDFDLESFANGFDKDKKEVDSMLMKKNEALLKLAGMIMEQRIYPVVDKSIELKAERVKPISYNADLDNNDYMEWLAKKDGKLTHL